MKSGLISLLEQRADRTQQMMFTVIGGFAALVLVCFVGWETVDGLERAAAVRRIVDCAHLHGDKVADAAFVNNEIDDGMHETGKSWRAGAQYAALVMIKSGLSDAGRCFVTQETLFSD